jgi:hypothetical protein
MPKTDPRVDAYIAKAADFARPILKEIRSRIHAACPACEETMKWSSPSFEYKGMLCGMGAFKEHCMFGFWKAELVVGGNNPHARFRHLTSVADLPAKKVMAALIHKAMTLNDQGVVVTRASGQKKAPARVPIEFADALKKNKRPDQPSRLSARVTSASTSSGSPRRSVTRRGRSGWRQRFSGSRRGSRGTGSTSETRVIG